MGSYVSDFGVVRYVGRGEGHDEKYDASAKPALGVHNFVEVTVDDNGPVANVGTGFGNGQAMIPAGAVVLKAVLLTDVKGSASGVAFTLVKKDGTSGVALLASCTPSGNNSVNESADEAAIGTRLAEDRYIASTGTRTGMKAKLIVEYI